MSNAFLALMAGLCENGAIGGNEPGQDAVFSALAEQGHVSTNSELPQ